MTAGRALLIAAFLLVVVTLGAGLFADLGKLRLVASDYPGWRIPVALALVLGNYVLRTVRFKYYLRAMGIVTGWGETFLVFVAGFLFTVTPGKMGEVVKGYLLKQRCGASVADVASSVVAERFTDVVGLLLVAAIGVAQHGAHAGLFVGVVGLCAIFLVAVLHPRAVPWSVRALGARARHPRLAKVWSAVLQVHGVLRQLCAPRPLAVGVMLAASAWLLEALAFRMLLDGVHAGGGLGPAVVIYAMATLFGAVSMLPGGVGSTEAVMVALCLRPGLGLGVDLSQATLATLLIRFCTLWFGVVLGAAAWAALRVRPAWALTRR